MEVKFCKDCKSSKPEHNSDWNNVCYNPQVVIKNAWALGNNCGIDKKSACGVSCVDERGKKSIFAACGMKGKLHEKV